MTWIIQENLTGISIKEKVKNSTRQDSLICTINKHGYLKDKCHANARLIAAAPDLLAACEGMVETLAGHDAAWDGLSMQQKARVITMKEAIKKAKGEL